MKDSSATRTDLFEGLKWSHVLAMLTVLRECDYTKKEHIKRRYSQHASHFEATHAFMACLSAIDEQEGHIRPSDMLLASDEADARFWLCQRFFRSRNRYRTQVFHYLRKFSIVDGEPQYCPSSAIRHHQSHVRNFLMEMGIVRHDARLDCYTIAPEQLDLYIIAQDSARKRTPEAVAALQRDREALGTAAEEAIVSYERRRVGKTLADRVEHVALVNAAAGYDVRSVTVNEDGVAAPRYIEVKAVSSSSLQFHWTRNEVRTAKILADWYYLYLLPVQTDGCFAIPGLEVIANPHNAVLNAPNEWAVEADVLRCCLRQKRMCIPGASTDGK